MSLGPSRGLSRGVVYGITIAPLLATLGFYFLEHVPSREEYFLQPALPDAGSDREADRDEAGSGIFRTDLRQIHAEDRSGGRRTAHRDAYRSKSTWAGYSQGYNPPKDRGRIPKKPGGQPRRLIPESSSSSPRIHQIHGQRYRAELGRLARLT